jgi:hypothetical protein
MIPKQLKDRQVWQCRNQQVVYQLVRVTYVPDHQTYLCDGWCHDYEPVYEGGALGDRHCVVSGLGFRLSGNHQFFTPQWLVDYRRHTRPLQLVHLIYDPDIHGP